MKQSAQAIWPQIQSKNQNNGKYTGRRCKSAAISRETNELGFKTRISILYLQLKFDEIRNDFLNQTIVFLIGVALKKINFCMSKINQLIYFKKVNS